MVKVEREERQKTRKGRKEDDKVKRRQRMRGREEGGEEVWKVGYHRFWGCILFF